MAGSLSSQTLPSSSDTATPLFRLGLYGGIAFTTDNVNLVLPGYSPDCGLLESGSGGGWDAGGVLDIPFLPWLTFHGRLGLSRTTGTMRHTGATFPIRSEITGDLVSGRVDEVVDYKATGIDATVSGSTRLFRDLHGEAGLGVWVRLFSDQTHSQEAVEPEELLLVNNSRRMELPSVNLFPYQPVVPVASLGLRYDLPIGEGSILSPEARVSYPFLSWTNQGGWRSLRFTAGASVRFGFPGSRPEEPFPQLPDTLPPRPPTLIADMLTAPEVVNVQIAEYDSTDWVPVLNRVFFAENQATIPRRYRELGIEETFTFSTADLTGPTIDVYHNVLNIIGFRMQRSPDVTMTVTGYRNGRERDPELGLERAKAVKEYLTETWDIFPQRLDVQGAGVSPKAVPERSPEGFEENAIVEMVPSDLNIIIPVQRTYILRVANPPSITFYPRAISEAGILDWKLEVKGEDAPWKTFSGEGRMPDSIRWDWTSDSGALPSLPLVLRYQLSVRDSALGVAETELTPIPVTLSTVRHKLEHKEQDTLIESYSLLLFDYDSPKISSADRELLEAIAAGVQPNSIVRFTGYTDSLGNAERNRKLAFQRAENAAEIFRGFAPKEVRIIVNPNGGENERFPYTTPEGRSYDRTVVIEVRTPIIRSEE